MDFLFLSPEFPPHYAHFVRQLDRLGVGVYGVGEADFYWMPPDLRQALKWYLRADLRDPAAVGRAVDQLLAVKAGHGRPGGFQWVESHNEQWLRLEAWINATYGVEGIRPEDLERIKKKSAMKAVFRRCRLPVAPGARVQGLAQGLRLADELGLPLILKPDEGVGAGGVHRVDDRTTLRALLASLPEDYLMEAWVSAPIVTYDGLADGEGRVLFESSLTYGDGVLEYVQGKDPFIRITRELPRGLAETGRKLVAAFGIRRKFFHIEFFQTAGGVMPIEVNCRPPGGPILDMMNYSADVDLYAAYALMITGARVNLRQDKPYCVGYLGRRDRDYRLSHSDLLVRYGHLVVDHGENPPLFWEAMGKYRYIFRAAAEDDVRNLAADALDTV
jgi:hypothetical protein